MRNLSKKVGRQENRPFIKNTLDTRNELYVTSCDCPIHTVWRDCPGIVAFLMGTQTLWEIRNTRQGETSSAQSVPLFIFVVTATHVSFWYAFDECVNKWELGCGKSSGLGVRVRGFWPTLYPQLHEHREVTPNLCPSHVKWQGWINQQPTVNKSAVNWLISPLEMPAWYTRHLMENSGSLVGQKKWVKLEVMVWAAVRNAIWGLTRCPDPNWEYFLPWYLRKCCE